ncbi:thiopeptide-type bacteriocin biosynthesis protein [Cellulophaga baltica]|uniref:Thiopeptide-type bacteriocin biosynthesis domain-containing protein n=1 Tax=Cellulophaga baltica TaxID=76594 RepID=A0A1G7JMY3_9FLAO|nr:thiopeptide-type bacteriocin biosynthesis protein [Cellulophaga baltica]SDF26215.1 thiopeptide-type bacteriocin biosynthesis domain-containing protein [Cellulophaga baltica]
MKRIYNIGEEWLFYKIYCGKNTADEILSNPISRITKKLIDQNIIDKWFYIRYNDPDFHIRVRFHIIDESQLAFIIQLVRIELLDYLDKQTIWKLQIENYTREIERYGTNTIESIESLFFSDTKLALLLIKKIKNEDLYIYHSMKYIDFLLTVFDFNDFEKFRFCENSLEQFQSEFELKTADMKKLNIKYNNIKQDLVVFLEKSLNKSSIELEVMDLRMQNNHIFNQLKANIENEIAKNNILLGIIHMFVNKLFRDNQRFMEMVIYDYLCKYYQYLNHRNA